MKVMTIFGTRPEIIRLNIVMKLLDRYCEHVTVHTGQNYHESLSDIFIRELAVRAPDIHLVSGRIPSANRQARSLAASTKSSRNTGRIRCSF